MNFLLQIPIHNMWSFHIFTIGLERIKTSSFAKFGIGAFWWGRLAIVWPSVPFWSPLSGYSSCALLHPLGCDQLGNHKVPYGISGLGPWGNSITSFFAVQQAVLIPWYHRFAFDRSSLCDPGTCANPRFWGTSILLPREHRERFWVSVLGNPVNKAGTCPSIRHFNLESCFSHWGVLQWLLHHRIWSGHLLEHSASPSLWAGHLGFCCRHFSEGTLCSSYFINGPTIIHSWIHILGWLWSRCSTRVGSSPTRLPTAHLRREIPSSAQSFWSSGSISGRSSCRPCSEACSQLAATQAQRWSRCWRLSTSSTQRRWSQGSNESRNHHSTPHPTLSCVHSTH